MNLDANLNTERLAWLVGIHVVFVWAFSARPEQPALGSSLDNAPSVIGRS
jgi:hypothetical protein